MNKLKLDSKVIAIIPARGGSKGIPGKNICLFSGKPLIAHSIEQAIESRVINRVIVSTEDQEIADISMQYGAEVIMRPDEISTDKASSELALLHVLDYLKGNENIEPELVVFLQATSPLRKSEQIDSAVDEMVKKDADSCFSACPQHFVGRWQIDEDGLANPVNYQLSSRPMRQDYPMEYIENGNFYIFKPWVLRESGCRLGGKVSVYQMNEIESMQIDTPGDLLVLEQLSKVQEASPSQEIDCSNTKLLVFDFDGVMTDNRVLVQEDGVESVFCHRGDGWGIARLKDFGLDMMVLSTEANRVVKSRCMKLKLDCIQNSSNKLEALKQIANTKSLAPEQIAYVGNDVNDLGCMTWVGFPITVEDAVEEVKNIARFTTIKKGGFGAVREICDLFLNQKKK